jgi:hypothetical protein
VSDKARKAIAVGFFVVAALVCVWPFVGGGGIIGGPVAVHAVIVHESSAATPESSVMFVRLRSGETAKTLKDLGHTLTIVDQHAVDQDGKEAAVITLAKPHIGTLPLPVLLNFQDDTKRLISKQSLDPKATDADVLAAIRKAGGE